MNQDVTYPRLHSSVDPYAHVLYGNLDAERSAVKEVKCIASANKLVELVGTCCRQPGCTMNLQSVEVHVTCGYTIKIEWMCESKHRGFWYSSPIYASGFAVNYIIESALLLSGMNHYQFLRFCKFINLAHNSPSTYLRNQRLFAAPAIHQEYLLMRDGIIADLRTKEEVVLCGDGRMDSPGYSATKATYSFMEENGSLRVVSMEHGDKREVSDHFLCVKDCIVCMSLNTCRLT